MNEVIAVATGRTKLASMPSGVWVCVPDKDVNVINTCRPVCVCAGGAVAVAASGGGDGGSKEEEKKEEKKPESEEESDDDMGFGLFD